MSGKPAARQGDPVDCPKKGHGKNSIASGSPDVLFNGQPAARLGDTTACGSTLSGQVIPNVLINGRPAVVLGSTGSHGEVVIGGSGDIVIGGGVSIGSGVSVSAGAGLAGPGALASAAVASTATPPLARAFLDSGIPTQALAEPQSYDLEEEEEEEETELPLQQRITLRLGVFFDGTGNNMANAGLTEQCRREDLILFDAEALENIASHCQSFGYTDSNGDGFYDRLPDSSYGNAQSNVALLYDLYDDDVHKVFSQEATSANLAVYIEGSGTRSGSADSRYGLATGSGDTGVLSRVGESPGKIAEQLRLLLDNNPSLIVEKIEFDIFGFSRGAGAARHFANELLKPDGGVLAGTLHAGLPAIASDFDWQRDTAINFVGVFDTVAAVANPWRGDLSPGDARNPGVNLYLPPGCARKVVQLTALNECRHNFSLNRVGPEHEEIDLPGVHSDIGGGYPQLIREKLLLTRPRRALSNQNLQSSPAWRDREAELRKLRQLGLPGEGRFSHVEIPGGTPLGSRNEGRRETLLAIGIDRQVRGELSRVALRIMHQLASQHGAVFEPIDDSDTRFQIPEDLQPIADKIIAAALQGRSAKLTEDDWRLLHARYIHLSAHWTPSEGILVHRPRSGGRAIYPHQPQRGYPQ
ncbi:type IV secretion protein Rhs [Pseudomonas sp. WN033]|nr:type IV secretion protein Rhs [Pseudomonas sp. WN033]